MDTELRVMLDSIDRGDWEKIAKLAEWLESQGDTRATVARQAATLDPQEIADELVKIRSMRGSNDSFFSLLAEIGLLGLFEVPVPVNLSTGHVESAPTTPRWWRPSAKKCLRDVEKALKTKVVPTDVSRAMTIARRVKADRLLALFQPSDQATPVSPPAPG
jgi:hypothetical protein